MFWVLAKALFCDNYSWRFMNFCCYDLPIGTCRGCLYKPAGSKAQGVSRKFTNQEMIIMIAFFLASLETDKERQQFIKLYEQYHEIMERVALNVLGEQHDAEDAVQNSFLQVIRHFSKVNEINDGEIGYWMVSIVKNEALIILRKRRHTVQVEDWTRIERGMDNVTEYVELVELFRELPETYRSILEMKVFLGYSDREIAKRLNITESLVSTRASRGRSLLKKFVERGEVHT